MLKIYKRKEADITKKLQREQLDDLFKTVKENGCDIKELNEAIRNGEFSAETDKISNEKDKHKNESNDSGSEDEETDEHK